MARRSLLRSMLWIALIFGAAWASVLLYWHASYRIPSGMDVALYLVALPLGLVAGYGGLRYGIDAVKRRGQKHPDEAATAAQETATAGPSEQAVAHELQVLASAVWFPAGETVQDLVNAARGNRRVGLHPSLRDARNLPVRAAGIDGIDLESIDEVALDEAQKRAVQLAQTLAAKLLEEHGEASPPPRQAGGTPPAVQVEWLLPARWTEAERQAAATWLDGRLAALGWRPPQVSTRFRAMEDGAQALQRLDEIGQLLHHADAPARYLLVASDSYLDDRALAALEHARDLHGPERPDGRVPGEGGCALLLARPPSGDAASLQRFASGRRPKPAATGGRLDTDTLHALATQALGDGTTTAVEIGHVVSDADQRPSRVAETLAAIERVLPDASAEQRLSLGIANGDSGPALALAAVAVAAALALESRQASLVVSVQSPVERAVALVVPPPAAVPSPTPVLAGPSS